MPRRMDSTLESSARADSGRGRRPVGLTEATADCPHCTALRHGISRKRSHRVSSSSPPGATHRVAPAVAPGELCASYQKSGVRLGPGHHIARSTMTGTPLVDRIVVDRAASASGFCPDPAGIVSSSTQIVNRPLAGTV